MIIAIDGPAGSGKSSTAKAVAKRLGFRHLDSGAFYRTITLAALKRGIPVEKWPQLSADELSALGVEAHPSDQGFAFSIDGRDVTSEIRSPEVNAHVSRMAAVTTWLSNRLSAGKHFSEIYRAERTQLRFRRQDILSKRFPEFQYPARPRTAYS